MSGKVRKASAKDATEDLCSLWRSTEQQCWQGRFRRGRRQRASSKDNGESKVGERSRSSARASVKSTVNIPTSKRWDKTHFQRPVLYALTGRPPNPLPQLALSSPRLFCSVLFQPCPTICCAPFQLLKIPKSLVNMKLAMKKITWYIQISTPELL